MTKRQGAALDRKKLFADPIMVTTVVVLIAFLTLFIIYPLAILLVDSFISPDGGGFTLSVFKRIFDMWTFRTAIGNTLNHRSRPGNSPATRRWPQRSPAPCSKVPSC